ncbi:protein fem-1 homolog CG6966-like [Macrobrachium nipponense]|uniref:protein fem-1 homolog CG6966-like n=1 Tax=Macrobrachium nipponense TaxID=159736 RepID=UPI0030C89CA5
MDKIDGSFVCVTRTFPSGVTYCVERAEEGRDSILCTAALLGHTNCVRILVEYREADVEELGSVSAEGPLMSGVSPLWCAASNGHYWVVDYLLSKGANPNGETSFNGTPLQAACALGYFEIVRLLEEHGAYIEAADNRAVTCLMLASSGGHLEIVKFLLEVGADVNGKNIEGESALHACAKAGHLEVMKLLLEHNARTGPDYSALLDIGTCRISGTQTRSGIWKRESRCIGATWSSLFNSTQDIDATVITGISNQSECLAAACIISHGISYKDILYPRLEQFCDMIQVKVYKEGDAESRHFLYKGLSYHRPPPPLEIPTPYQAPFPPVEIPTAYGYI